MDDRSRLTPLPNAVAAAAEVEVTGEEEAVVVEVVDGVEAAVAEVDTTQVEAVVDTAEEEEVTGAAGGTVNKAAAVVTVVAATKDNKKATAVAVATKCQLPKVIVSQPLSSVPRLSL